MEQLLDISPGSLSVMGLMNDRQHRVRLLLDEEVLQEPFLGCHPCINTSTVRLKTSDLLEILLPHLGYEPTVVRLTPDPT